jgi:hypothetical protein
LRWYWFQGQGNWEFESCGFEYLAFASKVTLHSYACNWGRSWRF